MTQEKTETKAQTACPHGREVDEYCPDCAPPATPEDARARAFDVAAWDAEMFWS